MNLSQNAGLRPDEALMVENAIRLAIDSVLNVLDGVNGGRCREYQRILADRDKEIHRLQREMSALRRPRGCASCGQLNRGGTPDRSPGSGNAERDAEEEQPPPLYSEPGFLSLFDAPSSHATSPTRASPTRRQAEPSAASVPGVKDEPCEVDAILVKREPGEERQQHPAGGGGGACWDAELELREVMTCEQADGTPHNAQAQQLRHKKRRVPTAQLAEEAQQQKRAAWRAASRRYYARKVARQMAGPAHFYHPLPSRYPSSARYDGARRRTAVAAAGGPPPDGRAWPAPSRKFHRTRNTAYPYREPHPEAAAGDDGGGPEEFLPS
ncbi:uncharacterized protein LOC144073529 [Stigmatopora argus]